ncbi:MAG: thioredoxin family protein [Proteobacteria bacterium]|nr:thioredoxin family protein [Pseudomonadota bacterium]
MGSFEEALARGTGWALLSVFGAGVATSLTPCVYPMIPITVSIFGARRAPTRRAAFWLATCYVMGIAAMYTTMGVLAALGGWAAGSLLASPWVVLPLCALLLALAASMFGLWEIHLPHWLTSRMALVGGRGKRGAFAMGLVGGVIIAPCTGPVLAGLLAYVASTRNVALGASLLFSYASGIGVLFWLLATFAVSLPKAGPWMRFVSGIFGVALVTTALYYLQDLVTPLARYTSSAWHFAAFNAALALGGLLLAQLQREFRAAPLWRVVRKTTGILLASLALLGLLNFVLTPPVKLPWLHDESAALTQATRRRRPILIDFSASWCRPCRLLESRVLTHPAVRRALSRFVLLKVDVSRDTALDRALQAKYRAHELPQLVLLGSDGHEAARGGEGLDPSRLLALLRQVR